MAVLGLLALMGAIAGGVFIAAQNDVRATASTGTLEAAASAQASYLQTRGEFATSAAQIANLNGGAVTYTSADSTSETMVSVQAVLVGGAPGVGLAVLEQAGRCAVLGVAEDGSGSSIEVLEIAGATVCAGSLAAS